MLWWRLRRGGVRSAEGECDRQAIGRGQEAAAGGRVQYTLMEDLLQLVENMGNVSFCSEET